MGQRKEGLPYLRDIHFCEFERVFQCSHEYIDGDNERKSRKKN
jgi:hypothetical protein